MTVFSPIGIVGAGTMGGGIAASSLLSDVPVVIVDVSEEARIRTAKRIKQFLDRQVEKGRIIQIEADRKFDLLQMSDQYSSLANARLVIEAVYEDLTLKQNVFRHIESNISDSTLLATNTSCLKVSDVGENLHFKDRLFGLHFFSPAEVNPIVEVIETEFSDVFRTNELMAFLSKIGKQPITCKDTHGFALNRFFVPYLNEAARIVDEGLATPGQVDHVATQILGAALGPFAVSNIIKPVIVLNSQLSLAQLGAFYTPAEGLKALGQKEENWDIDDSFTLPTASQQNVIHDRLLGAILLPVTELLAEGVTERDALDSAAENAFRFQKGPVALLDAMSTEKLSRLIDLVAPPQACNAA